MLIDENNKVGQNNITDTIKALSRVKIFGEIDQEINGKPPNYFNNQDVSMNGILYVTVFGKTNTFETLKNNGVLQDAF